MSVRRIIFSLAVILLLTLWMVLAFYLWQTVSVANHYNDKKIVTIGWDEWIGVLPYLVAYDQGYFQESGLKINLKKITTDEEMNNLLVSSQIDFAPDIDLVNILLENSRGNEIQVVGVSDISLGGDGIAARPGIDSIEQLKGKKVAVKRLSLSEKLLYYALLQEGMSLKDIQINDLDAEAAAAALINNQVAAAATYEPYLSEAAVAGNKIIYSSLLKPGFMADCLVARQAYINENPDVVTAVLESYFRAVDYIKQYPTSSLAIGAKYLDLTPEQLQQDYAQMQQIDLRGNITAFSFSAGYESLYGNGELTNTYLLDIGEIKQGIDLETVLRPEFVRAIYSQ